MYAGRVGMPFRGMGVSVGICSGRCWCADALCTFLSSSKLLHLPMRGRGQCG